MKTMTAYPGHSIPRKALPYPNAATTKEVFHKLLDGVLIAASGAGLAAMLLLLMALM